MFIFDRREHVVEEMWNQVAYEIGALTCDIWEVFNAGSNILVYLFQGKRACRRAAFFRHFGEKIQKCNGNKLCTWKSLTALFEISACDWSSSYYCQAALLVFIVRYE